MSIHTNAIKSILQKQNGYITAAQATNAGILRHCLSVMLTSGELYRVGRGIYALPEVWEDEMYFLQHRFNKGIFSHGTALYLHSMTDRTPHKYTMTFPHGYNTSEVKKQGLVVKVTSEFYELGITDVVSVCGNPIKAYNVERTLCDIVRGRNADDIQLVNQAMKTYAAAKGKDIAKLFDYAEKLRVKPKILRYMEVLL